MHVILAWGKWRWRSGYGHSQQLYNELQLHLGGITPCLKNKNRKGKENQVLMGNTWFSYCNKHTKTFKNNNPLSNDIKI